MTRTLWLLLAVGCGSGEDDSGAAAGIAVLDCTDDFAACGGDPSGTWNITSVCDPGLSALTANCPTATYAINADRSSGTMTLAADGTYDRDYRFDLDYELIVPRSCISPMSCAGIPPMSGGAIDACTESGEDCVCTGTFVGDDAATGTWTKDGDAVVTDGTDRTEVCVRGDRADTQHEDGTRIQWQR